MKNLYILITGLMIGWLIGMSESPVVSSVITSIISIVVILVTTLSGLNKNQTNTSEESDKSSLTGLIAKGVTPLPVMLLLIGIVAGAATGVYTRTHDLLSPATVVTESQPCPDTNEDKPYGIDIDALIVKYGDHDIPDSVIVKRALNIELPIDPAEFDPTILEDKKEAPTNESDPVSDNQPENTAVNPQHTALYNLETSICEELCGRKRDDFLSKLKGYAKVDATAKSMVRKFSGKDEELYQAAKKDCACR